MTFGALKLGAHSIIPKRELTPERLAVVVQEAAVAERVKRASASSGKDNSADAEIVAAAQSTSGGGEGYKFTLLIR